MQTVRTKDISGFFNKYKSAEGVIISKYDTDDTPIMFLRVCYNESNNEIILQQDYFSHQITVPIDSIDDVEIADDIISFNTISWYYRLTGYDEPICKVRENPITSFVWYGIESFATMIPELVDTRLSGNDGDISYFVIDLFRLGIPEFKSETDLENWDSFRKGYFLEKYKGNIHKTSTVYYSVNKRNNEKRIGLWDMKTQEPISVCEIDIPLRTQEQIEYFLRENGITF